MSRTPSDFRWDLHAEEGKLGHVTAGTFAVNQLQWTLISIKELARQGEKALDWLDPDFDMVSFAGAVLQAIFYLADSPDDFLQLPTEETIDEWREKLDKDVHERRQGIV